MLCWTVVTLVIVVLSLLYWHHKKLRLEGIPGPYQWPILCNLVDVLKNRSRHYDFMLENAIKTPKGTFHFVIPFGGGAYVLITDPPSVEHILKTNFENYIKGSDFKEKLQPLLGDGIFNVDGALWKEQRQKAVHMFKVKELRLMHDIFERHGKEVLRILDSQVDSGKPIDITTLLFCFTLDSIGEIAFGYNVDSLHAACPFSLAFDAAQEAAFDRFIWPFWKYSPNDPLVRHCTTMDTWVSQIIKERRQDPRLETRTDLLSRYMCTEGVDHSERYLRDIVLNFMIAGRDTTAQTLSWVFYNLAVNPDKQEELIKEVDSYESLPSYDEMKHMKYMFGVINETLRLCPPVPIDPKHVIQDDVLPSGYKIPAGANVCWSMYLMGRMEQYWEKPLQFMPERWLDPEKNKERHPYLFVPFQAGPRTCLGQNMAYLEIKVLLYMVLKRFRLHEPNKQKVTYRPSLTFPILGGLRVLFSRR